MLSPHPEKWGDASPPPRPPPIDARAYAYICVYKLVTRTPTFKTGLTVTENDA